MDTNVLIGCATTLLCTFLVPIVILLYRIAKKQEAVIDLVLGDEDRGMPSLNTRFKLIESELQDNSGSSLKDKVNRIDRALARRGFYEHGTSYSGSSYPRYPPSR